MTNSTTSPERHDYTVPPASPDIMPAVPKRGPGVRRMNRRPILLFTGILSLAVFALAFSFFDRLESNQAKTTAGADDESKVGPVNTKALFGNTPAFGTIPDRTKAQGGEPTATTKAPGAASANSGAPATGDTTVNPGPGQASRQPDDPIGQQLRQLAFDEYKRSYKLRLEAASSQTTVGTPGDDGSQRQGGQAAIQDALTKAAAVKMEASAGARPSSGLTVAGAGRNGNAEAGDAQNQQRKAAFFSNAESSDDYLATTRTGPLGKYEVKAGTVIPSILITGVNSDLPGQMIAQVQETVYSHVHAEVPVIPKGARLVGRYDSNLAMGQERVLVAWNRVIYPDGSSINIGAMPGADAAGYAGFNDQVDNHYLRLYGNAAFLSLFSAGVQLSQPQQKGNSNGYSSQQIIGGAIGQQLGQLGMEMTRRNMQIQPTLEIRPGYEFNIMVNKDIVLPPWSPAH